MIVRAVLPCPADRFSSNTLFGEPGISPQGSPMSPRGPVEEYAHGPGISLPLPARLRRRRAGAPRGLSDRRTMPPTARRLLVSVPTLDDPNFFRSVVFVIEHTDEGAVGLVLNQPTDARIERGAARLGRRRRAARGRLRGRSGATARSGHRPGPGGAGSRTRDAWQPLLGRVGTVDLGRAPADVRGDLEAVRVFAGYSGWGPPAARRRARRRWLVRGRRPARRPPHGRPGRAVAHGAAPPGRRPRGLGELPARARARP